MGHEDAFLWPRLSARCGFRKETIAHDQHLFVVWTANSTSREA
jgi:hypothetical protein